MRKLAIFAFVLWSAPVAAQPLIAIDAVDRSEALRMFAYEEVLWREIAPDIFAPADKPAYSADEEPATAFPHFATLKKAITESDVADTPALWCLSYINRYDHTRLACQEAQ